MDFQGSPHRAPVFLYPLTMENPIDRMIRLTAIAVGVVSLLVYLVFHFV